MTDFDQLRTDIQRVLTEHELMATDFVVLADVVDVDGERSCLLIAADHMKAWDSLGLLRFAVCNEEAAIIRDKISGET